MRPIALASLAIMFPSCSAKSLLLVCVHEADGLIDSDPAQSMLGDRADAFITVMAGGSVFHTSLSAIDSSAPQWHECFELSSDTESIVFVAADADVSSADDVLGVACTTVGTGDRWLHLSSPMADTRVRGRLRVQIVHISHAEAAPWLRSHAALSPWARPPKPAEAAHASVTCPSRTRMAACQCWTRGTPECATAAIIGGADGEACTVQSSEYTLPLELPPCSSRDAEHEECRPRSWVPLVSEGVRASALCVEAPESAIWHDVGSTSSLPTEGDAVIASCTADGPVMMGCATRDGDGTALGLRYVSLPEGEGEVALSPAVSAAGQGMSAAHPTDACVAYAAGGSSVRAAARCVSRVATEGQVTIAFTRVVKGGEGRPEIDTITVGCPQPFALVGCICFSTFGCALLTCTLHGSRLAMTLSQPFPECCWPHRATYACDSRHVSNCLGAKFASRVSGESPECVVSISSPDNWLYTGGEASARCVWVGEQTSVVMSDRLPSNATSCASLSPANLSDTYEKQWLPSGWRQQLVGLIRKQRRRRGRVERATREAGLLMFLLGALSVLALQCMFRLICSVAHRLLLREWLFGALAGRRTAHRVLNDERVHETMQLAERGAPSESTLHLQPVLDREDLR